ncbi:protein GVQW3 [Trichonephila clavipes]|nr:protein GVQW3 [Trichonephila clavipes]
MQQSIEQRYAIKFCVRLGKLYASTLEMIQQAYGRESVSQAQGFRWHKMFKEGRESVEDEPRAGRPSTSRTTENEQRVRHLLNTDRRLSVRMIAEQLGMDKMAVHKIICEDLGMRKICTKLLPKVLTDVQKQNREAVLKDLLERIEEDPLFFNNLITGDKSWFYQYDTETKRQSNEWHTPQSPRQKKARIFKSRMKAMLIVFFTRTVLSTRNLCPKDRQSMVPSTWKC